MEVGCFPLDPNGYEIVEFSSLPIDHSFLIVSNRILTVCMCLMGFIFNLTLITMIIANPGLLKNLRGILLIGSILETFNCLCTFLTIPFVYSTHGRMFAFANHGFHISSQLFNTAAIGVTTFSILVCWSFTTFQFVYRFHLVYHRTTPKFGYLFLYTMIPVCSSLIYGYCSMKSMNLLELAEEKIIKNRELILRHYGILIDKVEILETSYQNKRSTNADIIFGITMLINYVIIVYCSIGIHRTLRSGPVTSSTTRRLNRDMDRVLMFNAISPILYNVLPSAYMAYSVSKCDNYQWMGFMDTFLINLSFIFCPLSTIFFVRPFRITAQRWFKFIGGRRLTAIETSVAFIGITQLQLKKNSVPCIRRISANQIPISNP